MTIPADSVDDSLNKAFHWLWVSELFLFYLKGDFRNRRGNFSGAVLQSRPTNNSFFSINTRLHKRLLSGGVLLPTSSLNDHAPYQQTTSSLIVKVWRFSTGDPIALYSLHVYFCRLFWLVDLFFCRRTDHPVARRHGRSSFYLLSSSSSGTAQRGYALEPDLILPDGWVEGRCRGPWFCQGRGRWPEIISYDIIRACRIWATSCYQSNDGLSVAGDQRWMETSAPCRKARGARRLLWMNLVRVRRVPGNVHAVQAPDMRAWATASIARTINEQGGRA